MLISKLASGKRAAVITSPVLTPVFHLQCDAREYPPGFIKRILQVCYQSPPDISPGLLDWPDP